MLTMLITVKKDKYHLISQLFVVGNVLLIQQATKQQQKEVQFELVFS